MSSDQTHRTERGNTNEKEKIDKVIIDLNKPYEEMTIEELQTGVRKVNKIEHRLELKQVGRRKGKLLVKTIEQAKLSAGRIGKDKYRIYLDNGEIIDTYDNVILSNQLLLKQEITIDLYQKIQEETIIEENYIACKKYIDYRIRQSV